MSLFYRTLGHASSEKIARPEKNHTAIVRARAWDYKYSMRYREIITETRVMSSWIRDLTVVNDNSGDVVMALSNGRRYRIQGVGKNTYYAWLASRSKGRFWHDRIKLKHITRRIM